MGGEPSDVGHGGLDLREHRAHEGLVHGATMISPGCSFTTSSSS